MSTFRAIARRLHRRSWPLSATGLALAIAIGAASPAFAQQVQRIAAVVNDEVISIFDLSERSRLALLSSNLPDTPEQRQRVAPQVLRILIDERLQLQEADRLNVRVSEREMANAISVIEENNNIPSGGLTDFAKANGLTVETVESQIRASAIWQKLISRRVLPTVEIGTEEIDSVLERISANRGQSEIRVAEIVLPIDNPTDEPEVRATAEQIAEQLRGGASFSAIARQFSQSATAGRGGDIGWVQEGQLDPAINDVVANLDAGQISGVAGPDAYRIVLVIDRRQTAPPAQEEVAIKLRQMLLSLPSEPTQADIDSQISLARQISEAADSCEAFAQLSDEAGISQPPEPTSVRLGDLNDRLRGVISDLPIGVASEPAASNLGVQVVMVCERDDTANNSVRNAIREDLTRQRVDMLSRRYLRDLQRAAFIDLRI